MKFFAIFTLINIATANKKFEITDIIKYLLNSNLPDLFRDNRKFDAIIKIIPKILLITKSSLRNINPNITKNTVDNCFNILKVEGSRPYLASIFNLSVTA